MLQTEACRLHASGKLLTARHAARTSRKPSRSADWRPWLTITTHPLHPWRHTSFRNAICSHPHSIPPQHHASQLANRTVSQHTTPHAALSTRNCFAHVCSLALPHPCAYICVCICEHAYFCTSHAACSHTPTQCYVPSYLHSQDLPRPHTHPLPPLSPNPSSKGNLSLRGVFCYRDGFCSSVNKTQVCNKRLFSFLWHIFFSLLLFLHVCQEVVFAGLAGTLDTTSTFLNSPTLPRPPSPLTHP